MLTTLEGSAPLGRAEIKPDRTETQGEFSNLDDLGSLAPQSHYPKDLVELFNFIEVNFHAPMSDIDVSRLAFAWFERRGKDKLYFDPERGEWISWDSGLKRWKVGPTAGELYLLGQFTHWLRDQIDWWIKSRVAREGEETSGGTIKWQKTYLGALVSRFSSIRALRDLSAAYRTVPEHHRFLSEFDDQLELLPIADKRGETLVISLRTGQIRPAREEDRFTRITNFSISPSKVRELLRTSASLTGNLEKVLSHLAGTPERLAFFRRIMGKWAVGGNKDQTFDIAFGKPRSGKSALLDTYAALMGDLSYSINSKILTAKGKDDPQSNYELGHIHGVRMLIASELEAGTCINDQRIKELTGRHTLAVRKIYGHIQQEKRIFNLILDTNHTPYDRDRSGGAASRYVIMKCAGKSIPETERNLDLINEIVAKESDEFLAWIVGGAMEYLANGLQTPEESLGTSQQNKIQMCSLSDFIENFLEPAPTDNEGFISSRRLKEVYHAWLQDSDKKPRPWQGVLAELSHVLGMTETRGMEDGKQVRGFKGAILKVKKEED